MITRIKDDKILSILNRIVARWEAAKIKRFIVSREVDFKAVFISIEVKKVFEVNIESENGGLVVDAGEIFPSVKVGLRVTVGLGDYNSKKANGLGMGYVTDIISLRESALKKGVHKAIDGAMKMALRSYFDHHSEISEIKKPREFERLSKEKPINYYEDEKSLAADFEEIAKIIENADERLAADKKIENTSICMVAVKEDRWFVSFERGFGKKELRSNIYTSDTHCHLTAEIGIKDAEGRVGKFYQTYRCDLKSNLKDFLNNEVIKDAKKTAKEFYQAPVLESGLYRAVLSSESTYTLFHEGLGAHLVSAKEIDEYGATAFKSKISQRILPIGINVVDDPTEQNVFGAYRFDEEGQPAKKVILVTDGVLKDYLYDRTSAGRHNINANGHARAQFGELPEPRTGRMIITSTKSYSEKQLIKRMMRDCKKNKEPFCLYVNGRAGEVDVESGQFKLFFSKFYKIYPSGKTVPVSSAYIVGNPYVALNSVMALGNNHAENIGFCGAESGIVRTSGFCPSAYVEKVEVRSSSEDPETDVILDDEIDD